MLQAIFHGHSFVELLIDNKESILIDPFISWNPWCDLGLKDFEHKNISGILLTHGHHDHVGDTIFLHKKTTCPVVCMVELANWLQLQWVSSCIKVNIWGNIKQPRWSVKFVRADHSNSNPDWWYAWLAAWLLITIHDKIIYHAGDTAYFTDISLMQEYSIDCAFLPIGDTFTMWLDDALKTAKVINAKIVVPIHYNTRPSIKVDDMEFARQIMLYKYAVPKVLKPWQSVVLE